MAQLIALGVLTVAVLLLWCFDRADAGFAQRRGVRTKAASDPGADDQGDGSGDA